MTQEEKFIKLRDDIARCVEDSKELGDQNLTSVLSAVAGTLYLGKRAVGVLEEMSEVLAVIAKREAEIIINNSYKVH